MSHHQIVIIGGGNAGISLAAQLLRKNRQLDIAIIDPSEKHYYQPAWTLVGAGVFERALEHVSTETGGFAPHVLGCNPERFGLNGFKSINFTLLM
jgi:2-polyprenyl-6-methoxyphenol hydroxylase-like FAD-dependent oxidoreductase